MKRAFKDEIKCIFHHFWRGIIKANKKIAEGWESDFKRKHNKKAVIEKRSSLEVNRKLIYASQDFYYIYSKNSYLIPAS